MIDTRSSLEAIQNQDENKGTTSKFSCLLSYPVHAKKGLRPWSGLILDGTARVNRKTPNHSPECGPIPFRLVRLVPSRRTSCASFFALRSRQEGMGEYNVGGCE